MACIMQNLSALVFLLALFLFQSNSSTVSDRQSPDHDPNQLLRYIIQVEEPILTMDEESRKIWHASFLPETAGDNSGRLLHSYREVFSGFAARLSQEDVQNMAKKKGFVRAIPDRVLPLLTTHTPDFLGLRVGRGLWEASNLGKGVIIGVLDEGVTPGHPSFDDKGLPPPPAKWRGSCSFQSGCNNKLIGAKNLLTEFRQGGTPPVDFDGHGTHTSSTAAGNFVRNASLDGLAGGTAAGVAPLAHVAMYKVCDTFGCLSSDLLAGVDAAVSDGVDVISISIGSSSVPLDQDVLAIGAFGAVRRGIFVSCAAGNGGPLSATLSNEAPWMLTVAASSIDRSLASTVKLGNGAVIRGESLDQSRTFPRAASFPLYRPVDDPTCFSPSSQEKINGSIVVCASRIATKFTASRIKAAGGVAVVFISRLDTIILQKASFPSMMISIDDGRNISSYADSSPKPTASISFAGTVVGASRAPAVAAFSSRGPSSATPGIIKPDIIGPGVNILAAWPPAKDGQTTPLNNSSTFNIISGTSMATPHLSGTAALIKSVHPDWSPAAIKSAIITTADANARDGKPIMDDGSLSPAGAFAMGAGHVNPVKAADPGLVYDIQIDEYIQYLCGKYGSNGTDSIIRLGSFNCSSIQGISESQLNYPSILLLPLNGVAATVSRTVTNVGPASSRYTVEVSVPEPAVSVKVEPMNLAFSEVKEKKSFTVSAKWISRPPSGLNFAEGSISWVSNTHVVRSPIVIRTAI